MGCSGDALRISYLMSLRSQNFKNMSHVKSFLHFVIFFLEFVFVFVYLCNCVRICHCLCRLQMKPDTVLFPTMYDMFVAMLESWKPGCFLMIGLVAGEEEGEGEEGEEVEGGEKRL